MEQFVPGACADPMNKHLENILLMKMQIAWFVLFCVGAVCTALLGALAGTQWETTDSQTRFMIGVGVLGNVVNTVMALFSKAMARVKDGASPFVDDAGSTKTTVSASVTTESKPIPETKKVTNP